MAYHVKYSKCTSYWINMCVCVYIYTHIGTYIYIYIYIRIYIYIYIHIRTYLRMRVYAYQRMCLPVKCACSFHLTTATHSHRRRIARPLHVIDATPANVCVCVSMHISAHICNSGNYCIAQVLHVFYATQAH
jgi:hypothetical protein